MKKKFITIDRIPTILYGDPSTMVYLFVHGKGGNKEEAESFAEIVCERGYQVLSMDLPGYGERKDEIENFVPWKVVSELQKVIRYIKQNWVLVSLHATSFGAYCSLLAFQNEEFKKVLLVSPVVDMVKLIQNMMMWSNVTEAVLEKEKTIPTEFGETLDWQYYKYVKEHPIQKWNSPTQILYAAGDNLTDRDTMCDFTQRFGCGLSIMEDGKHWFHTEKQLAFLENWRTTYFL